MAFGPRMVGSRQVVIGGVHHYAHLLGVYDSAGPVDGSLGETGRQQAHAAARRARASGDWLHVRVFRRGRVHRWTDQDGKQWELSAFGVYVVPREIPEPFRAALAARSNRQLKQRERKTQ